LAASGPRFLNYVQKTLTDRLNSSVERKDFISYLLKAKESSGGQSYEYPELVAEARSLMIAGSDTTATQLAANLFYITQNKETLRRLTSEIRSKFTSVEDIRLGPALESCQFLTAVVEETLRMSPSLPGFLPREVLPGGLEVIGHFFPPGVEVAVTTYALHHDPRYFPKPHEHIPQRWLPEESGEQSVKEAWNAFAPFSYGSRVCLGKRLAYFELWITIARAVFLFDMEYVSGGREDALEAEYNEYKLWDNFSAKRQGPLIRFRNRHGLAI